MSGPREAFGVGPNPVRVDRLSAAERRVELCRILALGLVRLKARQSTELSAPFGESSLHSTADRSGHATPHRKETA